MSNYLSNDINIRSTINSLLTFDLNDASREENKFCMKITFNNTNNGYFSPFQSTVQKSYLLHI